MLAPNVSSISKCFVNLISPLIIGTAQLPLSKNLWLDEIARGDGHGGVCDSSGDFLWDDSTLLAHNRARAGEVREAGKSR